jgi:hypothetical protein
LKNYTPSSLSIQKEIIKHQLNLDSEIDKSINELGVKTLLQKSGITKRKGFPTLQLLFALILLPFFKISIASLWAGRIVEHIFSANKDAYYRFLNRECFNWRKFIMLLASRLTTRLDHRPLKDKVLIADDTILAKTGKNMELVSYHYDHTKKMPQLGYQMLQLGYHNGDYFYPLDIAFHSSKNRTNTEIRDLDHRTCGWKRRAEACQKKTDILVAMIRRAWQAGIEAQFILFDSWFAHDKIIFQIKLIGYDVITRLKRNQTRYGYGDQTFTLAKLWHDIARHQLHWVKSWQVQAAFLDVHLPKSGKVRIVFVRASKKQWHAFLSTDVSMELPDILKYYSRRWAIEVYFRDCKQMLYLGQGQSETFDAVIALASIVMLRYLLLVYILAKRHLSGPLGPLFRDIVHEHLQIAMAEVLWNRIKEIFLLSSQLFWEAFESENFFQLIDLIENILPNYKFSSISSTAKL